MAAATSPRQPLKPTVPGVPVVPIVCLLGPTASGKTAAALALAARHPQLEIVSVDSALVYRGMDIGTAKPSAAERAATPHHLIDIVDPANAYSAAAFVADARRAIIDIVGRGGTPLLVGGTMLYYRALAGGLAQLPEADPALRAALDADAARLGWPALHARLAQHDPATAARLAPNDSQRIQRALEVWLLTGTPMATLIATANQTQPANPQQRFIPISLEPSSRAVLHERIAQRFDVMLAAGLLDEVRALRARGDLDARLPSMRCVGYRQAWEYLDGEIDLPTLRERGIFATRQLCKRQLTWLRSLPDRITIDCCAADATSRVVVAAEQAWLNAT